MGDVTDQITEHFRRSEFKCVCGCGFQAVNLQLVERLECARRLFGRGITITSGCRCAVHNISVGGESNSSHLRGLAADLACITSPTRMSLLIAILTVAFPRVGIGGNFLHVDVDPTLPQDVAWVYPVSKARW